MIFLDPDGAPLTTRHWNAQRSLENAMNHYEVAVAPGVAPENSPEQNMA